MQFSIIASAKQHLRKLWPPAPIRQRSGEIVVSPWLGDMLGHFGLSPTRQIPGEMAGIAVAGPASFPSLRRGCGRKHDLR